MSGWSQFTVRFEQEQDAKQLQKDAKAEESEGLRLSYNSRVGPIVRIRIVGYSMKQRAFSLLEEAGPIETALLAVFNDTSDSGYIEAYRGKRNGEEIVKVAEASSPEVGRFSFELTVDGLTETGLRAGQDFSIEEKYETDDKIGDAPKWTEELGTASDGSDSRTRSSQQ